jgi:hypothetical protein
MEKREGVKLECTLICLPLYRRNSMIYESYLYEWLVLQQHKIGESDHQEGRSQDELSKKGIRGSKEQ